MITVLTDQWHLFEINKYALGLLIPPPRLPKIMSGAWKDATAFCCRGGECLSQGCRLNSVERGVLEALLRRPGQVKHPHRSRAGGTGKLPGRGAKPLADHPPSPPYPEKHRRFLLGSLGTCSQESLASPPVFPARLLSTSVLQADSYSYFAERQTEELQLLKVKEISRDSDLDPPALKPSASTWTCFRGKAASTQEQKAFCQNYYYKFMPDSRITKPKLKQCSFSGSFLLNAHQRSPQSRSPHNFMHGTLTIL